MLNAALHRLLPKVGGVISPGVFQNFCALNVSKCEVTETSKEVGYFVRICTLAGASQIYIILIMVSNALFCCACKQNNTQMYCMETQ